MAFDRYICSTFEEEVEAAVLINRILSGHNTDKKERRFLEGLLEKINEAPFRMAVVDGVVKGSPMDYTPEKPLTEKLGWVAFGCPEEWKVLKHTSCMILPYARKVVPSTPLLSIETHVRKFLGEDGEYISKGEVQTFKTIRYDQGRMSTLSLKYDPNEKNKKKRREERLKKGISESLEVLDNFEVDTLTSPQLGPSPKTPLGISSGQTGEIRSQIRQYIRINHLPKDWREADFYEFGRREIDDLDMMQGFLGSKKIEFVK